MIQAAIDKLRLRKREYQSAFGVPGTPGFDAMRDLARFCRAFGNDVVVGDHDRTLILAGRREAFWRIFQHLKLEPDELAVLYRATMIQQGDE